MHPNNALRRCFSCPTFTDCRRDSLCYFFSPRGSDTFTQLRRNSKNRINCRKRLARRRPHHRHSHSRHLQLSTALTSQRASRQGPAVRRRHDAAASGPSVTSEFVRTVTIARVAPTASLSSRTRSTSSPLMTSFTSDVTRGCL